VLPVLEMLGRAVGGRSLGWTGTAGREAVLMAPGRVAVRAVGGIYALAAALAATTPCPLNSAGLAVAAIGGLP